MSNRPLKLEKSCVKLHWMGKIVSQISYHDKEWEG